jgi:hypothetical protein
MKILNVLETLPFIKERTNISTSSFWIQFLFCISPLFSDKKIFIFTSPPRQDMLGVLTDRIISDFIRYSIWKIIKIIRFVSVSRDISIRIRIRNSFTDADVVRPLPIRIWQFSYYSSISDIIQRYPIWYYPIISEYLFEIFLLYIF